MTLPELPIAAGVDAAIDFLVTHCSGVTRACSASLNGLLKGLEEAVLLLPPGVFIGLLCLVALLVTRRWHLPLFVALGFGLLWNIGLWAATISTLTLLLTATVLAVMLGLPLGIAAAMFPWLRRLVMPTLDMMQTMPAFVYLIPAIPFFGLGRVSAVIATLIFAIPPVLRLTCLGIRQTPPELVECANAFGASRLQRLFALELPLAAPTIVAGINQTVMLALSMAVIAAMIGARGLGGEVWKAIQRLEIGQGFEAGLGIVIVAITLDRLFSGISRRLAGQRRQESSQKPSAAA